MNGDHGMKLTITQLAVLTCLLAFTIHAEDEVVFGKTFDDKSELIISRRVDFIAATKDLKDKLKQKIALKLTIKEGNFEVLSFRAKTQSGATIKSVYEQQGRRVDEPEIQS